MTVTRRRTLQCLAGAAGTVALAGCSSLGDDATITTLESIRVTNSDTGRHTVHVLVLDGENPVYANSSPIAGQNDDNDDDLTTVHHFEDLPEEEGTFVLYAWIEGLDREFWGSLDLGQEDHTCTIGDVFIEEDAASGDLERPISITATDC